MLFKLKADINFEADDIEDALVQLSKHFLKVVTGEDSSLFILPQNREGTIEITPDEEV